MKNNFKYKKCMDNLKEHPYTLLSLADKEKFHAGFIAYAINNCPELIKEIFGLEENSNNLRVES